MDDGDVDEYSGLDGEEERGEGQEEDPMVDDDEVLDDEMDHNNVNAM